MFGNVFYRSGKEDFCFDTAFDALESSSIWIVFSYKIVGSDLIWFGKT